jgi:hypothetical protein
MGLFPALAFFSMEYQKLSANVLFYETPLFLTSVAILQISRFFLHALIPVLWVLTIIKINL